MKKIIIMALVSAILVIMSVSTMAADNGLEWDFEDLNQYDLVPREAGFTYNPKDGEVCVDILDGKKVLSVDPVQAGRWEQAAVFKDSDFLDYNKKMVIQYDVLFQEAAKANYQGMEIIHRGTATTWACISYIDEGKLLMNTDRSGTVSGHETIQDNVWYNFAFVIDVKNLTYDFYVNGVHGYSGTFTTTAAVGAEDKFELRAGSYGECAGGKAYYDNIKLYTADLPDGYVAPEDPTLPEDSTSADNSSSTGSPNTGSTALVSALGLVVIASIGVVVAKGKSKR